MGRLDGPPVRQRSGFVHVVVPSGIDDPQTPSGGNAYDRRVCLDMPAVGWTVHEHPVAGMWPTPAAVERAALAGVLRSLPDGAVVLIDGLIACGVPEVVVPTAHRLRIAVLLHLPLGDEVGLTAERAATLAAREGETLRAVSTVVATSPWAARRVVELHGVAPERVHVAAPGVDPAPLAPGTDGSSSLLCVGSITPTKGQDLLVEALATVADRPWRCTLVGPLDRDPAHAAAVRDAIRRHGLAGRLSLTGPRTGERLAATYASADLLVLPSRVETYGMVVTEALARGIPVLAAAAGGVPETLGRAPDGQVPGILVPPDDVAALAEALRRWFDEPGPRGALRRAARQRREGLIGWEVTARCLAGPLNRLRATAD